jgi:NADPH:quinone reductase-like Zn-dependent oxidoreductase
MRAIVVHEAGGPDVLKLEEVPDPVTNGHVLVRVEAAAVNLKASCPAYTGCERLRFYPALL